MVISCMYWFKGLEQDEYYVKTLSSIVFFLLLLQWSIYQNKNNVSFNLYQMLILKDKNADWQVFMIIILY